MWWCLPCHCAEELVLLPGDSIHQYYEPRAAGDRSAVDGQSFKGFTRERLSAMMTNLAERNGIELEETSPEPAER